MTIKEIRSSERLTQAAFAEKYGIPKRTIENWEAGVNSAPGYLIDLIEFASENGYKKKIPKE